MTNDRLIVAHSHPVWLAQTQTWMYNQVKYLPQSIDAHILCERTENLDQFGMPNIHCLAEASRPQYYWDKGLRKLRIRRHLGFYVARGRELGADIVHSHFGNVGWANLGAVRRLGAKHVVTFYGLDVNRLPQMNRRWISRYQKLFREADLFLCEGPHMAKCLIGLGCPEEKIKVHHLGVEVDKIAFRPRAWKPGEILRVLIAATYREKKGIPYALEALAGIQHEVPLEVTIIGEATYEERSQKEKGEIMGILARTGLGQKTKLLGFQPHSILFDEAYKHHIFLSPSVTASDGDTEGGAPVGIIEMTASGMPIVSTTHCDIPNVIAPENQDMLADERDVEGLISRLRWLVENHLRWENITASGRRHVEEQFSVVQQSRALVSAYRSVLSGSEF